jgi:hypothetical protein
MALTKIGSLTLYQFKILKWNFYLKVPFIHLKFILDFMTFKLIYVLPKIFCHYLSTLLSNQWRKTHLLQEHVRCIYIIKITDSNIDNST